MVDISINSEELNKALREVANRITNMTPIMREIAGVLQFETQENFLKEGFIPWLPLRSSTTQERYKRGTWPGKILTEYGQLKASISTRYDNISAVVGTNKVYALSHQFGRGKVPARPFLPSTAQIVLPVMKILAKHMKGIL